MSIDKSSTGIQSRKDKQGNQGGTIKPEFLEADVKARIGSRKPVIKEI